MKTLLEQIEKAKEEMRIQKKEYCENFVKDFRKMSIWKFIDFKWTKQS
jgi:hypothetical protein